MFPLTSVYFQQTDAHYIRKAAYHLTPSITFEIVLFDAQIVIIGPFGYASPISSETVIVSLPLE